jgi:hypothetical protein
MKRWILVSTVIAAAGLYSMSWTPEADAQGAPTPQQLQLVVLESYCDSYTTFTRHQIYLRGNTLSILDSYLVYRNESSSGTGRYCLDVGLAALEAVAQAGGCTVTRYNVYDTATRTRGYQYFTCLGNRDALIELVGDLAVVVQSADFNQ